jgi:hypothetical protein
MEVPMAISDEEYKEIGEYDNTEAAGFAEAEGPACDIYIPCSLERLNDYYSECQEVMFARALSGETEGFVEMFSG